MYHALDIIDGGVDKKVREVRREHMEKQVADTYADFKARYGAPRIAEELNALNIPCSTNYIADILRKHGLKARNGKAFNYGSHALTMHNVADNLLRRKFEAGRPNEKWTTDITYIWVDEQWLYLATVMDLYSRCIVGWALDTSMTEQLVTDALVMAFDRREIEPGLIIHSDRGVQYRSQKYIDYMKRKGCRPSMSRKGNCWDTQSTILLNVQSNLTRAGIGEAAFALTCRLDTGVPRVSPGPLPVT
ncbi:MAG: IS3 family transposase [Candidatus Sedimenticola sp. (ex Thyasira tokunagai)]